jgi:hypothetical protein
VTDAGSVVTETGTETGTFTGTGTNTGSVTHTNTNTGSEKNTGSETNTETTSGTETTAPGRRVEADEASRAAATTAPHRLLGYRRFEPSTSSSPVTPTPAAAAAPSSSARSRLLGYRSAPNGRLLSEVTPTQTDTGTAVVTGTSTGTASFTYNPAYQTLGGEALLFPPLLTSAGLILQVSLRYIYGINSSTACLVWFRVAGSGVNHGIDLGAYGAVSFTTQLALSEDEAVVCGGTSAGDAFCASTADGALLWREKVTSESGGVTSAPTIYNSTLLLGVTNDAGGTSAGFHAVAYSLTGALLWRLQPAVSAFVGNVSRLQFSVVPAFVSPTVDALAIAVPFTDYAEIYVVDPVGVVVLETVRIPQASPIVSNVAVDAANALFVMTLDAADSVQRLYRVDAARGTVDDGLVVGGAASAAASPNYLSLVVGNGAAMLSDFNGALHIYS